MSANRATLMDERGESPDWFEFVNFGDAPVDMEGWGVSDDPQRPMRWTIRNLVMPAGGYALVFASGRDEQPGLVERPPDAVPGLVRWFRAGLVDAEAADEVRWEGSVAKVMRWRDASRPSAYATEASEARQPEFLPGVGGKGAALRFDGMDDRLLMGPIPGTNDFTVLAVVRPTGEHQNDIESTAGIEGVSGQRWLLGAGYGGEAGAGVGLSVGVNGAGIYEHGAFYMPARLVTRRALGSRWNLVRMLYSGRQPHLAINGALVRQGEASIRSMVTAPTEIGAGQYGAYQGDLAELIVYERALTTTELQEVESSLARRHDITLVPPRHASFSLSAAGESLSLTLPDGTLVDRVIVPEIPLDVSFGRPENQPESLAYFAEPTPGGPNVGRSAVSLIAPPRFSIPGGFHPSAVQVGIDGDVGVEIRYTVDGSEPTETSSRYEGPLLLGSRTGTPNTVSQVQTTPGGPVPMGEVFKGWVVRARAYRSNALPSEVSTRTWWIHPAGRERYTVPVISLAVERDDFFGNDRGIYVPGGVSGGNYSQRGDAWERRVHVEMYGRQNEVILAQDGDVKIHGETSRALPLKGLDLDGTGGRGRRPFRGPLFEDRVRDEFEHLLLRPAGQDQAYAFMRDDLMQELVRDWGVETQGSRLVVVFVNGEYWGLHYLKEKHDTEYLEQFGADPDHVDFLERYAVARNGDTDAWGALMTLLDGTGPLSDDRYDQVKGFMDVDNFATYKAAEAYTYRWDMWNHRLWRNKAPGSLFRWLHFDFDVAGGGFWAMQPAWEFDMLHQQLNATGGVDGHSNETTTHLLRRLVRNADFRNLFINRVADLANTTHSPAKALASIDRRAAELTPEIAEHISRWRSPSSEADWLAQVALLRRFATDRPAWMRQHVISNFGLSGGLGTLRVRVLPAAGGSVRVNGIEVVTTEDQPWVGTYFREVPIVATPIPSVGWRWGGWAHQPEAGDGPMTLQLSELTELTAMFVPAGIRNVQITRTGNQVSIMAEAQPGQEFELESSRELVSWSRMSFRTADAQGVLREEGIPLGEGPMFFRWIPKTPGQGR